MGPRSITSCVKSTKNNAETFAKNLTTPAVQFFFALMVYSFQGCRRDALGHAKVHDAGLRFRNI
jgi:hypothetical protein